MDQEAIKQIINALTQQYVVGTPSQLMHDKKTIEELEKYTRHMKEQVQRKKQEEAMKKMLNPATPSFDDSEFYSPRALLGLPKQEEVVKMEFGNPSTMTKDYYQNPVDMKDHINFTISGPASPAGSSSVMTVIGVVSCPDDGEKKDLKITSCKVHVSGNDITDLLKDGIKEQMLSWIIETAHEELVNMQENVIPKYPRDDMAKEFTVTDGSSLDFDF